VTAFPADPPALLDDAATIQAHDWQAYRHLHQMETHWNRPGWTNGRRSYHWILSFRDVENVRQLAEQCQMQLQRPELDVVPPDTLHVTLGRLGFTDEMARTEVHATADEASAACSLLAPFSLTIGPLTGSTGAVRFSVSPWSQLMELHRELTKATRAIRGARCVMETSQFRPHLSIAYANTTVPMASLLSCVEQLRTLPTENAVVSSVQLVELRREDRTYRFELLQSLRLAG
jgi:2'-5' RNA ligase